MIRMKVKTRSDVRRVIRRADRARTKSIFRAAAFARGVYRRTVGKRAKPRAPGNPATSPTGRAYKGTLFGVEKSKDEAVIGPSYRIVGPAMGVHEHGKRRGKIRFPKRPVGPKVVEKVSPRLPEFWKGVIR